MTPEKKAIELVCTIFRKANGISKWDLKYDPENWKKAKKCALIAVEEILNSFNSFKIAPDPHKELTISIQFYEARTKAPFLSRCLRLNI